ncbi:hypothetical protein [Paenibacillus sp. NPDC058071]|uniref:hypothetical protein n=1 Tax=Paenibacillus sp. NPDC058071 TaxID=3346326 RepID=UPI0036DC7AAF
MKKYTIPVLIALASLTSVSLAVAGSRDYAPVPRTPSMKTVYIEDAALKGGHYVFSTDEIGWYEGKEANRIFREREADSGLDSPPDGYYIVNDDPSVQSLPVADDAVVLMQIYNRTGNAADADIVWDESISLEKFVDLLNDDHDFDLHNFPYHLTIENGKITRIVQQYIP